MLSRFSDPNDEEVARLIYEDLHPGESSKPDAETVSYIKSEIERLRASVRVAKARPRPSEARLHIKRAARLADDLASCLNDLGPEWRSYVRLLVFQERERTLGVGAVPVVGVGSGAKARARMDAWMADLERLCQECEVMEERVLLSFAGPKKMCGFAAREIILKLTPDTVLTKGEPFYSITAMLWSAASNGDESSVKRACDELVDIFRDLERARRK